MPSLTAAEVASHNTEKDAYIIIKGKVYDVSGFASTHPGGKKILLNLAGKDASKQFETYHSPAVEAQYLPKLLVGEVSSALAVPKSAAGLNSQWLTGKNEVFGDFAPFCEPAWYLDNFTPYYKESHRRLRAMMRNFIETEVMPYAEDWEEKAAKNTEYMPKSFHQAAGKAGILRAIAGPSSWGKDNIVKDIPGVPALPAGIKEGEFDFFHELIIWDELARCGHPGVGGGLTTGASFAVGPIIKFGSPELRNRVIPDVMSGSKQIALCITEPHAGSDVQGILTTGKMSDDGKHFIVNGEKKWITNGTFADYFTAAVRTGGAGGAGISVMLIERGPTMKTRQVFVQTSVLNGTSYVTFEDHKVAVGNLLGKINEGFKTLMLNFNRERMTIGTNCVRMSRTVYADALHYAHRRKTFGKLLIDHPVIRDKFAQMARQIEALQAWTESIYYQMEMMPDHLKDMRMGGACALLKLQGTRTFEYCAREACQIMGGISYTRGGQGGRVERLYREVRGAAIPGGSEEIMADIGMRQSLKASQLAGAQI